MLYFVILVSYLFILVIVFHCLLKVFRFSLAWLCRLEDLEGAREREREGKRERDRQREEKENKGNEGSEVRERGTGRMERERGSEAGWMMERE